MSEKLDIDSMSDEDFMKLSEADFLAAQEDENEEEETHVEDANPEDNSLVHEEAPTGDETVNPTGDDTIPSGENQNPGEVSPSEPEANLETGTAANANPHSGTGTEEVSPTGSEGDKPSSGEKTPDAKPNQKEDAGSKEGEDESKPDANPAASAHKDLTADQVNQAVDFWKQVTTPFKADGKDMQVRSPQDAIRLMQQGANYSRRMEELKPARHLFRMLTDQGIADEKTLSFLVDLKRGDKSAITKLLKDNNIDPLDLNTEQAPQYNAPNYAGSEEVNTFRDRIAELVTQEGGQELIQSINSTWDDQSKNILQKYPETIDILLEEQKTGDYAKVTDEIQYQQRLGYLSGMPFLQAYKTVSDAMRKVGVLKPQQQVTPQTGMAPMQAQPEPAPQTPTPVVSGTRKAAEPKMTQPNPALSSTPVHTPSPNAGNEVDYDKLTDEEFMKLPPPV